MYMNLLNRSHGMRLTAFLLLLAAPLAAQHNPMTGTQTATQDPPDNSKSSIPSTSCPAGDSALRLPAQSKKWKAKYDEMTDLTTTYLVADFSSPMFKGGDMSIWFTAAFQGRTMGPARLGLDVDFRNDAALSASPTTIKEHSRASQMEKALVLVDDSVRFAVAATSVRTLQGTSLLTGEHVNDLAQYQFTIQQAIWLANARVAKVRIFDRTFNYDEGKLTPLREFVRTQICGPGMAPDSTLEVK